MDEVPAGRLARIPAQVSRRGFLLAGAGLVVASACGGGTDDTAATTTSSLGARPDPGKALNVVLGTYELVAGPEQRMSFGVLQGLKPVGPEVIVEMAVGPLDGALGPFHVAPRRADGIENRPLHVLHTTFPKPGNYRVAAKVDDVTSEAKFEVKDAAASKVPMPTQAMPAIATPTTKDAKGVDPICTRTTACPWHDMSLDDALADRKSTVLIISTPALCKSAVCGPVLEIMLGFREQYAGKINFVHAEVYTDNTGNQLTPVMKELHLPSEPYLFIVDAKGLIQERIEGPFDRSEASDALAKLAV